MSKNKIILQQKVTEVYKDKPDKIIALVYWYNDDVGFKEFSTHCIYPNSAHPEALNHGNYYKDIVQAIDDYKERR